MPRKVLQQVREEAHRALPNETGGILMGYWADPYTELVVTDAVGPGPNAIHYQKSFTPDARYQEAEVARIYHASRRISTYLGDWHTHPFGSGYLSRHDKKTLHKIAKYSDARCDNPVMAIISGSADDRWFITIWKYERRSRVARVLGIKVVRLRVFLY